MVAVDGVIRQLRKPSGILGQIVARKLNHAHDALTSWGLEHVEIATNSKILDIGCGGGATIRKLATIASVGKVYGIDYSQASVKVARNVNRKLVEAGRVEIRKGIVSSLPFPANTFDLVTAIETHYFWPDLIGDMKEVLRVLKHAATFLVVAEVYIGSKTYERFRKEVLINHMTLHTIEEFGGALREAGFIDVKVYENYQEGWMCGVCKKP